MGDILWRKRSERPSKYLSFSQPIEPENHSTISETEHLGNTVLVVEHDRDTILAADYVLDLGPGAGEHGGRLVAAGTPDEIIQHPESLTGK